MLELQPWKAVKNNVMGTLNMADAAEKYAVRRFVLVSTDKAVRPANVMGATKRVAELILQSRSDCNRTGTQFFIVRFGNVVGSIGSVVPLFKKQIADGGPVTITHPEVTRYFMTIPEACQLILQSAAMGVGGEIFILKMGPRFESPIWPGTLSACRVSNPRSTYRSRMWGCGPERNCMRS
jgi:FlaA1/EpsC-like NDP-sugar epimerase